MNYESSGQVVLLKPRVARGSAFFDPNGGVYVSFQEGMLDNMLQTMWLRHLQDHQPSGFGRQIVATHHESGEFVPSEVLIGYVMYPSLRLSPQARAAEGWQFSTRIAVNHNQ